MMTTMEKEKEVEQFDDHTKALRIKMAKKAQLRAFVYEGEGLIPPTNVETFKDHRSNVLEFKRYAKRTLEAIQGANKQVVNLSDYLNVNRGAASALREALVLFDKQWNKDDSTLNEEHFGQYARLDYMLMKGTDMPAGDMDLLEGNFLWTYAKEMYAYRDQYVSKFLEDAAKGNDALVLQLKVLRDNPKQITRTKKDWDTTLVGAGGLAAAIMGAFYDADKLTVSPEQEMNLRRKIEMFTLDFNASLAPQVQAYDKNCKEHCEVISRIKGAGSEVCGRALTIEGTLYSFQCGIFESAKTVFFSIRNFVHPSNRYLHFNRSRTPRSLLPALASAPTTSMAAEAAGAVPAGVVAAAPAAVEDPEAAAESGAPNHVAGNSWTRENATATIVATIIQTIFQKSRSVTPRVQNTAILAQSATCGMLMTRKLMQRHRRPR